MPGAEAQIIGGHKANIHNPNTSLEAKDHSRDVLKDEYNIIVDGKQTKDVDRVAAGLKGALHNPQITEEAQFAAAERLGEVQK